jgi:hypothetical protein
MKIFEIIHSDGEKEWVSGETNIEALRTYISTTGCDLHDMDGSEIVELPKDKWKEYTVKNEDEEEGITFEQWMQENKDSDVIAGTMYDI